MFCVLAAKRSYNSLTFSFLAACCFASRSWDTAQWIPRSRISFDCEICCDENFPFFLSITRTESRLTAANTSPMVSNNFKFSRN